MKKFDKQASTTDKNVTPNLLSPVQQSRQDPNFIKMAYQSNPKIGQ